MCKSFAFVALMGQLCNNSVQLHSESQDSSRKLGVGGLL